MNKQEEKKLAKIAIDIGKDKENINRAKGTYIKDNIIYEPKIMLTLSQYRDLCRLANIKDILSVPVSELQNSLL